ncbi:MAG: hypothetical protein E5299_00334 [Burkholderia gladioli]|nr:MAG: hypothetical protein E5299_00334 [Burkholderia gladioli]
MASTGIILGDTDRFRTSKVHHAVNYADARGELGCLRVDVMRPETGAGERLESIHRILGNRSSVGATVFLSFATTFTGKCINRAFTTRCTGRIRWPMSETVSHHILMRHQRGMQLTRIRVKREIDFRHVRRFE